MLDLAQLAERADALEARRAALDARVADLGADLATLGLACRALAKIVREEYPSGYSLHEIAATWGNDMSAAELEALRDLDL